MPMEPPARTIRSASRPLVMTWTPMFSWPTRFSAGTSQSSKISSAVGEPRMPHFFSLRDTEKPGKSFSTMKALMPLAPCSGEVLA